MAHECHREQIESVFRPHFVEYDLVLLFNRLLAKTDKGTYSIKDYSLKSRYLMMPEGVQCRQKI